jgi:hypothetical protein
MTFPSEGPKNNPGMQPAMAGTLQILFRTRHSKTPIQLATYLLTYSVALVRRSDLRLSAKLVPTSADSGYHVVSVTDPYGRILGNCVKVLSLIAAVNVGPSWPSQVH